MRRGFVIGNGPSRLGFDLERLRGNGITIGCNKLYRDFTPDYLVALDQDMRAELDALREWPFTYFSRGYDERKVVRLFYNGKPDIRFHNINGGWNNNSGVTAASLMVERIGVDELYLLGVDFFRVIPGSDTNDVYGIMTYPSRGIVFCYNRVAVENPQTRCFRVGPIPECDAEFYANEVRGYTLISYEEFADKCL